MVQQPNSSKFLVTPEKQKGLVSVTKTPEGVTNFQWTSRATQASEMRFMLFPGEVTYKKVNTGREGDRVYMMKWNNNNGRILMYWMQDKSSDKDDSNCTKMNAIINNQNTLPSAPMDAGQWMNSVKYSKNE